MTNYKKMFMNRFLPTKIRPPFSLATYLAVFLFAGILAFGLLAKSMLEKIELVKSVAQKDNQHAAQTEVQKAGEVVLNAVEKLAADLSVWDEVHQQLATPIYYAYWQLQLLRSEQFPHFLKAVEIYGPKGKSLATKPRPAMPPQLPDQFQYITYIDNQLFLIWFVPIESRDTASAIAGYIGLKISLLEAMLSLNRFLYVDAARITAKQRVVKLVDPKQFMSVLSFGVSGNKTSTELEKVMVNTLKQAALLLIVIMGGFYGIITVLFSVPLKRLEKHIDALRRRKSDLSFADPNQMLPVAEIEKLRRSINSYQEELNEVHARLDKKNEELWIQAHKDPLTGVYNRRAFDADWRELEKVVQERNINVSFMLFDCDFFKTINDTYGHDIGDLVIKGLAESLKSVLRAGDKLYRLGGDEFATFLLEADADQAGHIADRCLDEVKNYPFSDYGIKEPIKVSIGISHINCSDPSKISDLPKHADLAMYRAKQTGRQKVVHFVPEIDNIMSNKKVAAVLHAINTTDNLDMHYQPIVKADSGKVEYYEALIRLRDDEELLGPEDIFPIVEKRSLQAELDLAVIKQIHTDLRSSLLPPGAGVSINLSGMAFTLPDVYEKLALLEEFTATTRVMLEVTETTLITQIQQVTASLDSLRKRGFIIALDDFGSGYSSIRYLANMPIDIVKFDISLIRDIDRDDRTRMIIENTAKLILGAGLQLVAEGIETEETKQRFIAMGVTHLQGFLLGKPQKFMPK